MLKITIFYILDFLPLHSQMHAIYLCSFRHFYAFESHGHITCACTIGLNRNAACFNHLVKYGDYLDSYNGGFTCSQVKIFNDC